MGPQRSFRANLLKENENDSMKELRHKISVEREKKRWRNISGRVNGLFLEKMTVIPNC